MKALGLIETVGLVVAIEAADAAIKAANVQLVGYEKTKGGGWIMVKVEGDVGAVKAAVAAGVMAAEKVGKVKAHHIIPRPHSMTEPLIGVIDRGGHKIAPAATEAAEEIVAGQAAKAKASRKSAKKKEEKNLEATPELAASVVEEFIPPVEPLSVETVIETPEELPATLAEPEAEAPAAEVESEVTEAAEVCNLCGDPACPRRKGQPYKACIHYQAEGDQEA